MHKRHNAQRQHIIHSFDSLLYQLHALSFFLSPSVWALLCRMFAQFQCSKPRTVDPSRTLRFWYIMVVVFNAVSLWSHATEGASQGRAVVLDFIGMAYLPSKTQLLCLDFLIIFLQMLLTTISYETSLSLASQDNITDNLLPLYTTPSPSTPSTPAMVNHSKLAPPSTEPTYIIDLRITPIIERLRNPPPPPSEPAADSLLPLPNTTPWPLPASLRMLLRARAEIRRRAQTAPMTTTVEAVGNARNGRGLPGSMDTG